MKLLFVCSRNQWRSPAAEYLFRRHPRHRARSAGTSPKARRRVSAADIVWADHIFVTGHAHKKRLQTDFAAALAGKPVSVPDIPDQYGYLDEELQQLLRESLHGWLHENPPGAA